MNIVKKNIAKISVVLFVVVTSAFTVMGDIFDNVAAGIQHNSAKEVANYFNSSVELNIENNEGVYSKTQAEMVLKNFFGKHPCTGFKITHRAKSYGNNSFAIGSYSTKAGEYRVTIYVKEISGKNLIHEMKFEKE